MWDTFCVQAFCIYFCNSDLQKSVHHKNYVYNLYTKFIQNLYTNNCRQHGSHISTYFDPFVVHALPNNYTQLRI